MKTRRHFSPEQKATIVRRHLAAKEAVSSLADEFQIQPSQIHLWTKQVLDQADRAFESNGHRKTAPTAEQTRLRALEAELARKNAALIELLEQFGRLIVARHLNQA